MWRRFCWTSGWPKVKVIACAWWGLTERAGPMPNSKWRSTASLGCWWIAWGSFPGSGCCCGGPTHLGWRHAFWRCSRRGALPWAPCLCCVPKSWRPSSTRLKSPTLCAMPDWPMSCRSRHPKCPYRPRPWGICCTSTRRHPTARPRPVNLRWRPWRRSSLRVSRLTTARLMTCV